MTKFDSTPYEKALTLELEFGNYVSNSNFTSNMSGLLGIVEKEKDGSRIVNYEIVPRGAQNGGDIIHLKLEIGGKGSNDVYYLRIKIIPSAKIQSLSVSGDKIVNCEEGAQGEASITRVYLSDLIQVENINDVSQLTASVVSNDSAGYVLGLGTNCIEEFNNGKTGLEAYGLRLKATNLGGAQIKIIIRDKFGYQVTDSSGEPITITLHYKKTDGTSVELNKSNSSSEIYEGDTFSIWAVAYDEKNNKDVYARYISDGNWEGEQDEQGFNEFWAHSDNANKQLILLDNITFGHDANDNLTQPRATVSISQSAELTTINSGILNGMTINYVSNTNFTEEKISGNNFVVRVSDNTETISFNLSTTIKQRYKIITKDPYNKYSTIYIPIKWNGTQYDKVINPTPIGSSGNVFQVYDNKTGQQVSTVTINGFSKDGYKQIGNSVTYNNFLVQDGSGIWEGTYKITINGQQITDNTFKFNYQYVSQYVGIDTSDANMYTEYGLVISGTEGTVTANNLSMVKLVDYYGNKTGLAAAGAGFTDLGNGKTITAGGTISVNFYGDKNAHGSSGITSINVYRSPYTGIIVLKGDIAGTTKLPFSNGSNGWGDKITATPGIGGNASGDNLTAGGGFNYGILFANGNGAQILLDATTHQYNIEVGANCTEITINITYLNISIGMVKLTFSNNKWSIDGQSGKLLTGPGDGASYEWNAEGGYYILNGVPNPGTTTNILFIPAEVNGAEVNGGKLVLGETITNIEKYKIVIFVSTSNEPGKDTSGNPTNGETWEVKKDQSNTISFQRIQGVWRQLFTVTINANGGTLSENSDWTISGGTATKQVPYGTVVGTLPTATPYSKTGYDVAFDKFYDSESGGNEVNSNKTIEASLTIYARYTEVAKTYTVTIRVVNGTIPETNGWTVAADGKSATKVVTYDSPYGTLPDLENYSVASEVGYTYVFAGWKLSEDESASIIDGDETPVKTDGNHELYAKYTKTPNKYKITFNKNGGTGGTDEVWFIYDEEGYINGGKIYFDEACTIELSSSNFVAPTKDGYQFNCYTDSSGNHAIIDNDGTYDAEDDQSQVFQYPYDLTFDAVWIKKVTITFDPGSGGLVSPKTQEVLYGRSYGTLPTPTKSKVGYTVTFKGWFTASSGGNKVEETTTVTNESDHTLYAQWEETANSYTVTIDACGGEITFPNNSTWGTSIDKGTGFRSIAYGLPYDLPTTVTKSGYTFLGWYTSETGGSKVESFDKMRTAFDHTLYAHWVSRVKINVRPSDNYSNLKYSVSDGESGNLSADGSTLVPVSSSSTTITITATVEGYHASCDSGTGKFIQYGFTLNDHSYYTKYNEESYSQDISISITVSASGGEITVSGVQRTTETCCLTGETLISMADGTQKQIKDVVVGDKVLSYNTETHKLEITTVETLIHVKRTELVYITFADGSQIKITPDHPMFSERGWIVYSPEKGQRAYPDIELQATGTQIGDMIFSLSLLFDKEIVNMEYVVCEEIDTYTFTTKENHNYFAQGVLVHNKICALPCCVDAETEITMANGTTKIAKDVQIGDEVMSFNELTKTFEKTTIEATITPYRSRIIEITFEDGTTLKITDDHPMLSARGWICYDPEFGQSSYSSLGISDEAVRVGDEIVSENGTKTIASINVIEFEEPTLVYTFKLANGQAFIANGNIVASAQ